MLQISDIYGTGTLSHVCRQSYDRIMSNSTHHANQTLQQTS